MTGYRLYGLDGVSKVSSGDWFEADDDQAAIAAARKQMDGHDCELWQGARFVTRIQRQDRGSGRTEPLSGNQAAAAALSTDMDQRIHEEPSDVSAEEGSVVVDGPDGVAVTLTPAAAEETSARLEDKAGVARDQQRSMDAERPAD